jgi:hypothetical protein
MKLASMMIAISVLSAGILVLLTGWSTARELCIGMLGPMAATSVEWIVLERTYRQSPERTASLMLVVFFGKIVFFGAFVAALLATGMVRPAPFVASFVGFFVALQAIAAIGLHRLTSRTPAPVTLTRQT